MVNLVDFTYFTFTFVTKFTKIMEKAKEIKKDNRHHIAVTPKCYGKLLKAKAKFIEIKNEDPSWSDLIESKLLD